MLVVMGAHATREQTEAVCNKIMELGYKPHPMPGANRTAIGITGNETPIVPDPFENMPGVVELIPVTQPYKLISRELKAENTEVQVGGVTLGGPSLVVIAGPCAVETEERTIRIAEKVKAAGGHMMRGGRLQAPDFTVQLSRTRSGGSQDPGKSARGHRPSDRHRSTRRGKPRPGRRVR